MRRPSGFTLLEVMVSLVLTGVVALSAYAAAQVSFEARTRIDSELRAAQSARAVRELLIDALRNARPPLQPGDTVFTLAGGQLSFIAGGTGPPLDADYDWRVTVYPDSGGLVLVASPAGRAPAAQVGLRLPGATRWEVQVLAPGGTAWAQEWTTPFLLPAQVAIRLWDGDTPRDPPLQVELARGLPRGIAPPAAEDTVDYQ